MRLLDWAERAFLTVLYLGLAAAVLRSPQLINLLLLLSEGLAVIFVLTRRAASSVSTQPSSWAVASAATLLPMLLRPGGAPLAGWPAAAIAALGLAIVTSAKFSLNRRLGMAPANRGVQARWSYAIVRHPMYLGYGVAQAGFLLNNATIWNAVIVGLDWILQLVRIRQEEAHLGADPAYRAYAKRVRFRLIPWVY
jgi:protein-S-isoprenylcysteine O-methyltransferase Ste14